MNKQRLFFLFNRILIFSCLMGTGPGCAEESENFISHGPILGRLSAHGIGIWARTAQPGTFAVRYGTAADELTELSAEVQTRLCHDNTGWIHITGLTANTTYYYDLVIPGVPGIIGRSGSFMTLPDPVELEENELNPEGLFNFSFEFACGNNQNPGHSSGPALPAFETMLKALEGKIHFAILNGDWLYEARRTYKPSQWLAQVGCSGEDMPDVVRSAPTIVGVWENYKHFLTQGKNLAQWHSRIPSFFTYDDHEILNDVWGAGSPGLRDRRAVYRDIGVRAWYDYIGWSNPIPYSQPVHFGRARFKKGSDVLYDPKADFTRLDLGQAYNLHVHWGTETAGVNDNALDGVGGEPNAGVYDIVKIMDEHRIQISPPAKVKGESSYSIGRRSYFYMGVGNCDFFFLDTRGMREMHDTRDPFKKDLSILGKDQREWLVDGVKKSDADFIFILSSVNFMIPHVGGGKVRADNKDDAWTVFFDEREMLIDTWDKLDKPVLVLTGDLHNSFVIRITDNVWEFASGPHNSDNHLASDEGNRPPNGPFKYGPRQADIRWSTYFHKDMERGTLHYPGFCVVQVNNVLNNPVAPDKTRWLAYPKPQVIFRYYDGLTGDLRYAEAIVGHKRKNKMAFQIDRRDFLRIMGAGAVASAIPVIGTCAAAPLQKPNILFLFADDQRFNTIRALNNREIITPNLDALVDSAVCFTHSYIMGGNSGAICMPSRAMLMTGRSLFYLKGNGRTIPEDHIMLPELLRQAGYTTFGTGKWHNGPAAYARCFSAGDEIFFGGMEDHWNVPVCYFDPEEKYDVSIPVIKDPWSSNKVTKKRADHINPGKHSSELFADAAINFLQNRDTAEPFFAYVSFTAPHDPRSVPEAFLDLYDPDTISLPENFKPEHPFDNGELKVRDEMLAGFPRTPEEVRRHIVEYYAMITHLDAQIGRIMQTLKRGGMADNTIVIFSGDNGLAVGQHGLLGKQNLYEHSVHVPLIMSGPGLPAGEKRHALCYLLDIYPTLCDLLNLPTPGSVQGSSLKPVIRNKKKKIREALHFAYKNYQRALRTERWKLILYNVKGRKRTQLFDLENDPLERNNLASDPSYQKQIDKLTHLMSKLMIETGDPVQLDRSDWGVTEIPAWGR